MVCDAHNGMAENIERLRDGQERLFQLTTQMSVDMAESRGHITQLFELSAQSEDRRKEDHETLQVILDKVNKLCRKPSLARIAAVVVPALLGSGGVAALLNVFLKGAK